MDMGPTPYIIDTSTPESLERDFYAWLNGGYGNTNSYCLSLPPLNDTMCYEMISDCNELMMHDKHEMYSLMEGGSVGCSPSSISGSSIDNSTDNDVMNTPPSDRDVARSSGRNQLGRTYSPGLPLSMYEREEIVKLFQAGWKICDISKRLCVTHSCVSKILNRFRQTGNVRPKDAKEGRTESPLVVAVRDYRMRLGMTRQSEIREQLIRDGVCTRETAPSRSSINHILRTKLDIKRRKRD